MGKNESETRKFAVFSMEEMLANRGIMHKPHNQQTNILINY